MADLRKRWGKKDIYLKLSIFILLCNMNATSGGGIAPLTVNYSPMKKNTRKKPLFTGAGKLSEEGRELHGEF